MKGIDVDEAKFLSECDEARIRREREIRLEEKREIDDVKISLLKYFPLSNNKLKNDLNQTKI